MSMARVRRQGRIRMTKLMTVRTKGTIARPL
jgi:hypothetical protein